MKSAIKASLAVVAVFALAVSCIASEDVDASGKQASAGGTEYDTIAEAITSAADRSEVTVLSPINDKVVIPLDKEITIDLNGQSLNMGLENNGVLTLIGNGTVTNKAEYYAIENKGTLTIGEKDGTEFPTVTDGSEKAASLIRNGTDDVTGTLTIYGGTFIEGMNNVKNEPNSNATIYGGTFKFTATSGSYSILNYGYVSMSGGHLEVDENPFWNADDGASEVYGDVTSTELIPYTAFKTGWYMDIGIGGIYYFNEPVFVLEKYVKVSSDTVAELVGTFNDASDVNEAIDGLQTTDNLVKVEIKMLRDSNGIIQCGSNNNTIPLFVFNLDSHKLGGVTTIANIEMKQNGGSIEKVTIESGNAVLLTNKTVNIETITTTILGAKVVEMPNPPNPDFVRYFVGTTIGNDSSTIDVVGGDSATLGSNVDVYGVQINVNLGIGEIVIPNADIGKYDTAGFASIGVNIVSSDEYPDILPPGSTDVGLAIDINLEKVTINGIMKVSIPLSKFSIPEGEVVKSVSVFYYDESDLSFKEMEDGSIVGGEVVFTTEHNSQYYMFLETESYQPVPPSDDDDELPFIPGQGSSSGSDDPTTMVAVAAGAAVVAIIAMLLVAISKGKL